MPIFLKAVPKLEATLISIPPPIDEQSYQINELISQPLNAAISLLTPSVQVQKENVQQIFSARKNRARRIHVISSPIYEVQYECSPPSQKIEPLHLSNKKSVAELLLKPPKSKKAEIFDQIWLTTKFEVAYGKHSAVPTTISRTQKQIITKVDAERRKGKFTSALSVMPQAPVQIKQLIKAPPIKTVELCCIDSTVEAKKIKEIYVEESEYQVIRTEDYSYTESTTIEYTR
uniref:Uncharacterized protein n=1 Tax=Panagrolaimus sp. PS1159 TaxID=55785 RepID=A0AC35FN72_9BILA